MPTKVENDTTGIEKKKNEDSKRELTSVVKKKEHKKQDADGEAGVDAQVEQLNDMPNDPTDRPKEKGKVKE